MPCEFPLLLGEYGLNPAARSGIFAGIVLLISVLNLTSQDTVPPATSPDTVAPTVMPDRRENWTVEVRTGGGLDGQGVGGFTLISTGELTCDPPNPCSARIQAAALQSVGGLINSMDFLLWVRLPGGNLTFQFPATRGLCSDCIVTTMVLRLRDSQNVEWVYSTSWDTTTRSKVPIDFMRIFQNASELASPRSAR
jgi:hypothetical protein